MRFTYFILTILFIFFNSCSNGLKDRRTKTPELSNDSDSLEYKEIMINYGNYWQNTKDREKNILFDNYNGKLIIFKNFNELNKSNESDNVFTFEIDSLNPKRLVGNYGFIERDTIMYWTFDDKNLTLTDDKGQMFKQIKTSKK